MKNLFAIKFLILFPYFLYSQNFPVTKSIPKTVTKFGVSYQDDFTWLENMKSEETKNWTDAENEVTNLHFEEIKKTYDVLNKIKKYFTFSSNKLPTKKEAYYYSIYKREGQTKQFVLPKRAK